MIAIINIIFQTKVTMTDDGSILFPSITICKNEMYNIFDKGLIRKLETWELSVENVRSWFREVLKCHVIHVMQ